MLLLYYVYSIMSGKIRIQKTENRAKCSALIGQLIYTDSIMFLAFLFIQFFFYYLLVCAVLNCPLYLPLRSDHCSNFLRNTALPHLSLFLTEPLIR